MEPLSGFLTPAGMQANPYSTTSPSGLQDLPETRCKPSISLLPKHKVDKLVHTTPTPLGRCYKATPLISVLHASTRVSPEDIADFTGTDQVNPRHAGISPHDPGLEEIIQVTPFTRS